MSKTLCKGQDFFHRAQLGGFLVFLGELSSRVFNEQQLSNRPGKVSAQVWELAGSMM